MDDIIEVPESFLESCVARWIKEEEEIGCQTVIRQFNLNYYGIADIVTISVDYGEVYVQIFELKKGVINEKAIMQVLRYRAGMIKLLDDILLTPFRVKCHLIGSCLHGHLEMPVEGLEGILNIWEYSFNYSGFKVMPLMVKSILEDAEEKTDTNTNCFVGYDYAVHDEISRIINKNIKAPEDFIPADIKIGLI